MDFLKKYPVESVPETWAFNDIFLPAIERQRQLWSKHGYSWLFGQEHEFIPRTVQDFRKSVIDGKAMTPAELRVSSPFLAPSLDLFTKLEASMDSGAAERALGRLTGYIRRAKDIPALSGQVGMTAEEMIEHLHGCRRELKSSDAETAGLARLNAYLAWLHLLPARHGGVRDLISPRFGSHAYGTGWWDNPGVAELRTQPLQPFKLIGTSHRILRNVFQTGEMFGVIPCCDNLGAHLHFSLWHDASKRNVMGMKTKEDIALGEKMLTGLYTIFLEAPHLINDFDPQDISYFVELDASGFRGSTIRQTGETWELRRSYESGFVHMARDVAMIMGGAAYGAFEIKDIKKHQKQKEFKIERAAYPLVTHKYGGTPTPMQRVIEASRIGKDGRLTVRPSTLGRYFQHLVKQLGAKDLDAFQHVLKGNRKPSNLASQEVWHHLVQTLRIKSDNSISARHNLHPALQDMLEPLAITGQRTVLDGSVIRTTLGLTRLKKSVQDLMHAPSLRFALGSKALAPIMAHYHALYEAKMIQAGDICAIGQLAALRELGLTDKAENPENVQETIFQRIFSDLISPCFREQFSGSRIVDISPGGPEQLPSHADYLKAENSIKSIRPHFRRAVEGHIKALKNESRPDNFLISGMNDVLDFLDDGLMDFGSYCELWTSTAVISAAIQQMNGVPLHQIRTNAVMTWDSLLSMHFQTVAQDPAYTLNDISTMIEHSKTRATTLLKEKIEKLKKTESVKKNGSEDHKLIETIEPAIAQSFDRVQRFIIRLGERSI
jgi:hypothetical protein